MRGIAATRPGATLGDIGHAIQRYAEGERCSVVRDFCGHGLGQLFHDSPNVLHYGQPGEGATLEPGMLFTIEPMINLGKPAVKILSDGWTAVTRDRELSAQFEHTVGVTETGVEIFTLSPAGLSIRSGRSAAGCLITQQSTMQRDEGLDRDDSEAEPHYIGHRQRLRSRFVAFGAESMPDYELLELVLFRVVPRRDVKPMAKALIQRFGSFAEVVMARPDLLMEVPEITANIAHEMKLMAAVAHRIARGEVMRRPVLSSWSAVLDYVRTAMAFADKEQFRILFLDKKNILIADEVQQTGTVDHTPVYPREVARRALDLSATAICWCTTTRRATRHRRRPMLQ